MTRDEQLIKAALDMAAETCEKSAYAADADGHHFAYSIRAIDPAEVVGVRSAGVYIASKTKYASEWLAMRENGYPIISTWIDEAGKGETRDWPDLWSRCISEASSAKSLVVISRDGDTLKGAWVEVGAALGAGKTVFAAGCHSFTIRHHPRFVVCALEAEAFARAALAAMETSRD